MKTSKECTTMLFGAMAMAALLFLFSAATPASAASVSVPPLPKGDIFGDNSTVTGAAVSNNSVTVTNTKVGTSGSPIRVIGGQSVNGNLDSNTVTIDGSEVYGPIYGGYVVGDPQSNLKAQATNNSVTITGNSTIHDNVYGAYAVVNGTLTGNTLTIEGGTVHKAGGFISGGYNGANFISGMAVTNNTLTINGGNVYGTAGNYMEITGGKAQYTTTITGNAVNLTGGTISYSNIYGGFNAGGSGVTTNNTVTVGGLGNAINITNASIYGGSSKGDAFTANTLNMNQQIGGRITAVGNFQYVTFNYAGNAMIGSLDTTATNSSASGVILTTAAGDITFDGTFTGTGTLTKMGAGNTLKVTGDGAMATSGVFVNEGTLQLGDGGTTGSLGSVGAYYITGTLAYNHSNAMTETAGQIIGTGTLNQLGSGTLTLIGNGSGFTGAVTVAANSTLQFGNGGVTGSLGAGTYTLGNNATLAFNQSSAVRVTGAISNDVGTSAGQLIQRGSGSLTVQSAALNNFTGGTEIESGTLVIVDSHSLNQAATAGSKAGYITFTGATGQKSVILNVPPGKTIELINSFRTKNTAGTGNSIDLTSSPDVWIAHVRSNDNGGAFSVASGTTMDVKVSRLMLEDNQAASGKDLFVDTNGTFNLHAGYSATNSVPTHIAPTATIFKSGIEGTGTLNIDSTGPFAFVQFINANSIVPTYHMGTATVKGTSAKEILFNLARADVDVDPRVTFSLDGSFTVSGDGTNAAATVAGDGIIDAKGAINVTNGAVLYPYASDLSRSTPTALISAPGTLTLKAPTVTLNNFGLAYYITGVSGQEKITSDGGIPTTNNSLLNIVTGATKNKATLANGTIFFGTPTGNNPFVKGGDYLIITSDNGFNGIGDNGALNKALTASIGGFDPNQDKGTVRGGGRMAFKLGGAPDDNGKWTSGATNVWFTAAPLNSLAMNWTARTGDWTSGNKFISREAEDGRATSFLPGDEVYISGSNAFTITLPATSSVQGSGSKITVSGLVVGQSSLKDDPKTGMPAKPVVTDGGSYTITGAGGITADADSAYGRYEQSGELGETGKLEKWGNSTLTFLNTGGNLFKAGVELNGGTMRFTRADQLATQYVTAVDVNGNPTATADGGIWFKDDATLEALNTIPLMTNKVDIASGVTGTFGAAAGAVFTYTGALTGDATTTFNKSGAGTVRLEEVQGGAGSSFAGQMAVSGGTLVAAGIYPWTAGVTVKSGGTLAGTSTGAYPGGTVLGGNTVIEGGGRLKPDDMTQFSNAATAPALPTPLEIFNGDLTFDPGGNFDVRITQFGQGALTPFSDLMEVDGTVKIDSAAKLNVFPDFWGNTLRTTDFTDQKQPGYFTVIDSAGGAEDGDTSAKFTLRSYLPRGMTLVQGWGLSGDPLLYQLRLGPYDPSQGFAPIGNTHNRTDIGGGLDWLIGNGDKLGNSDVIKWLSDPDADLSQLDEINGDLTANAFFMAFKEPWRHPFNRLKLGGPDSPPSASAEGDDGRLHPRMCLEFNSRYEDTDSDGDAHGFTIRRYGFALGLDHQVSPDLTLGANFQLSSPTLRQDTGQVKADDAEIGVYGLARLPNDFHVKTYFGVSRQEYTFTRTVSLYAPAYGWLHDRLNGSTDGRAVAASVELTRPFDWRNDIRLVPVAAFDFEKAWIDGYRESGGEDTGARLAYDDASMERFTFRFGLNTEYQRDRLALQTRAQYLARIGAPEHPSVDVRFADAELPGQPAMNIWGDPMKDYVNLGLGVNWELGGREGEYLYLNYDVKLNEQSQIHAGEAGFMLRF
jgi:autotransporter-associated beta strand protein